MDCLGESFPSGLADLAGIRWRAIQRCPQPLHWRREHQQVSKKPPSGSCRARDVGGWTASTGCTASWRPWTARTSRRTGRVRLRPSGMLRSFRISRISRRSAPAASSLKVLWTQCILYPSCRRKCSVFQYPAEHLVLNLPRLDARNSGPTLPRAAKTRVLPATPPGRHEIVAFCGSPHGLARDLPPVHPSTLAGCPGRRLRALAISR